MMTQEAVSVLLLLCGLLSSVSPRPGDGGVAEGVAEGVIHHQHHHNYSCENGELRGGWRCECDPCWEGDTCLTYVDYYTPRFLVHAATAVLPVNATGVVYRAWSTDEDLGLTCPLGPGDSARCPCAAVNYRLFAAPGDNHFSLDPVTGILSRNTQVPLNVGATYIYKLMVQGMSMDGQEEEDLPYDLLTLKVYVSADYVRKIPWT
ncbi:protein jagged-1-like [Homarus americanus]|uniref:protein jagged-1-like n=1 Tax=Homarus americanus TaxID=6706 RepID=UPI001C478C40|nr:protein jagged-1-like [Homarus americanus]